MQLKLMGKLASNFQVHLTQKHLGSQEEFLQVRVTSVAIRIITAHVCYACSS